MSLRTLILHPASPTLLHLFLPPEIKPTETSRVCPAITELLPPKFQGILSHLTILTTANCTFALRNSAMSLYSTRVCAEERFTAELIQITLNYAFVLIYMALKL